jgi:hypothetical protein
MVKKSNMLIKLQFTEGSSLDLRGRQSVRTTFKISERCIDALSILAGQMGIKQKSLFDHLVDDAQALETIAREYGESNALKSKRIAKTYVISRRSLDNLEQISARYNTPRDVLVEFSIERILPLIEQEKEKHAKRKEIFTTLTDQLKESLLLLEKAERDLGEEDPLVQEMRSIVRTSGTGFKRILSFIEKGKRIENF